MLHHRSDQNDLEEESDLLCSLFLVLSNHLNRMAINCVGSEFTGATAVFLDAPVRNGLSPDTAISGQPIRSQKV